MEYRSNHFKEKIFCVQLLITPDESHKNRDENTKPVEVFYL